MRTHDVQHAFCRWHSTVFYEAPTHRSRFCSMTSGELWCFIYVLAMPLSDLFRGPAVNTNQARQPWKQYKYEKQPVEASIANGERVASYLREAHGNQRADRILQDIVRRAKGARGSQPSNRSQPDQPVVIDLVSEEDDVNDAVSAFMPHGFWKRFMTEEMAMAYTARKRMQFSRSLQYYALRKYDGAMTMAAMRGMRPKGSCRSAGGAMNNEKAPGLGFSLLQWFVDYVHRLQSRSDSTMLIDKAREMRADLKANGWREEDLPKMENGAEHQWFKRWREKFGIVKKVTGMKLKVPWVKVKKRIRVFLRNVFRLRAFWEICHPGTEMRWISLDQKPSWFNNAGLQGTFSPKGGSAPTVREDFKATRERYSILTAVQSWKALDPNVPPKIAVLVKAAPDGIVVREMRGFRFLQPWMLPQAQQHGSYRSSDMVQALNWMLPQAQNSSESIVVILDWYSGHLTDEVLELVKRKGHVLIFHGGGCTPFTQINDTHLHSQLARLLLQLENKWKARERQRLMAEGKNQTPKITREVMVMLVQQAWLMIDHEKTAEKGYKQTGPTMSLRGVVAPEDVFKDLLRAMDESEPSDIPTEVSMKLRDEAVAFVQEGFDSGKWTTWSDCWKLLEEQDGPEEALAEGLEMYGVDENSSDDEDDLDDDNDDDNDDDDGHDGPGDGPGGEVCSQDDSDNEEARSQDGGDEPHTNAAEAATLAGAASGNSGAAAVDNKEKVAAARQLLFDEAVKTRDDLMVRHMRKKIRDDEMRKKMEGKVVCTFLQKRVQEYQEETAKRLKAAAEENRLAAKDLEETKLIRARAEEAAALAKLASLQQIVVNRRDAQRCKHEELVAKNYEKWLQLTYPAGLARHIIDSFQTMQDGPKAQWEMQVRGKVRDHVFRRQLYLIDLWVVDKTLTDAWASPVSFAGGHRRQVRVGTPFLHVVDDTLPSNGLIRDPVNTLLLLWVKCVPLAKRIFTDQYNPLRILHVNDYVLEKAFVYGIMALVKWMGREHFPIMPKRWPPEMPKRFELPEKHFNASTAEAVSTAPVPVHDDSEIPPHLRVGLPAGSSTDVVQTDF